MELVRKKDSLIELEKYLELWDYIERLSLIVSGVFLDVSKHLTKAELDFFCRLVVLNQMQTDLYSKEAIEYFNSGEVKVCDKRVVQNYLKRLLNKGWVNKIDSDYILPNIFSDLKSVKLDVKLTNKDFEYEINRQDNRPADNIGSV